MANRTDSRYEAHDTTLRDFNRATVRWTSVGDNDCSSTQNENRDARSERGSAALEESIQQESVAIQCRSSSDVTTCPCAGLTHRPIRRGAKETPWCTRHQQGTPTLILHVSHHTCVAQSTDEDKQSSTVPRTSLTEQVKCLQSLSFFTSANASTCPYLSSISLSRSGVIEGNTP